MQSRTKERPGPGEKIKTHSTRLRKWLSCRRGVKGNTRGNPKVRLSLCMSGAAHTRLGPNSSSKGGLVTAGIFILGTAGEQPSRKSRTPRHG